MMQLTVTGLTFYQSNCLMQWAFVRELSQIRILRTRYEFIGSWETSLSPSTLWWLHSWSTGLALGSSSQNGFLMNMD